MAWASGQPVKNGHYTIQKEIDQGGFGITYGATDSKGQRFVIKTLNDTVQRRPDFDKFQQDFLNEALRLAKCTHPHVVKIYEVFQEGGLWCMVMEHIDGEDLANRAVNWGTLPETEALGYIQQIGEALAVVHRNGLLHRDIKPQNIMLRAGKSEAVLIDFGIAREFTPNLTQTHTQFWSDGFAPIEQYDRRAKRDACGDVYALAATLYTILTGEVPTPAPNIAAGTPLTPPKQHNPRISDRVNRAILKGMALKAKDRPQSVREWLELLGVGNSSPVPVAPGLAASPPLPVAPQGVVQMLIGIAVGVAVCAVLVLPQLKTQPPISPTHRAKGGSEATQSPAAESPPPAPPAPTATPTFSPQPVPRKPISTPEPSPSPTLAPESFALARTLTGHSNSICFEGCIAFSPDGRWLASGSDDNTIKIWSAATGDLQRTLTGHSNSVISVAFSPDGRWLASGSDDNTIKIWSAATGDLQRTLTGHSSWVHSVAFTPDGRWLASGGGDATVKIWSAATGDLQRTLTGHSGSVFSVAFSPDGRWLASGSSDFTVKIWSAATGDLQRTLTGHSSVVYSVAFSPDGRWLASGSNDNTVKIWSAATGDLQRTLTGHSDDVNSVAFSPDGRWLASGSDDNTVRIWSAATGELQRTLTGHSNWVESVAFSPDGRWLASGSDDKTVKIWRVSP
ncbi:serine/threonine-protein kinase [Kamptonema formosum]|uniref:serine/threonine-protein kinase n=1 Tax=Kamptonema formosum TaxID=331992 RepID=UPI000349B725|nr:serine/threonine-protein kinase [Oscillatoria sp. PCC 10802]